LLYISITVHIGYWYIDMSLHRYILCITNCTYTFLLLIREGNNSDTKIDIMVSIVWIIHTENISHIINRRHHDILFHAHYRHREYHIVIASHIITNIHRSYHYHYHFHIRYVTIYHFPSSYYCHAYFISLFTIPLRTQSLFSLDITYDI